MPRRYKLGRLPDEPKQRRVFGGHTYYMVNYWRQKTVTKRKATWYRKQGYRARVVQHKKGWVLYIR